MNPYLENIIEAQVKNKTKAAKKEKELEEVVDEDGNILGSRVPPTVGVATITAKKTTDDAVKGGHVPPSNNKGGVGSTMRRYWGETDLSKALGYEETLGKDKDYEKAKKYFEKELGFDEREAEDRLDQLGYEKKSGDKVRLIEKSPKSIEEMIDNIMAARSKDNDLGRKDPVEIPPLIQRQLTSLKETLKSNNISVEDIIAYLK